MKARSGTHTPGLRTRQLHTTAPDAPHYSSVADGLRALLWGGIRMRLLQAGQSWNTPGLSECDCRDASQACRRPRSTGPPAHQNRARERQLPGKRKPGQHSGPCPAAAPFTSPLFQRPGHPHPTPRSGGMMPIPCNAGPQYYTGGETGPFRPGYPPHTRNQRGKYKPHDAICFTGRGRLYGPPICMPPKGKPAGTPALPTGAFAQQPY